MRRGRFAKAVALLLVVSAGWLVTGCFGKFQLTRKVYEINKTSVDDPYVRSALTWVLVIVPVYGFSAFLDLVLFNVIEFWSGENPVASAPSTKVYVMGEDRVQLTIAREDGATVATLDRYRGGSLVSTLRVRDGGGAVTASVTEDGVETKRITAIRLPDGSVEVATLAAPSPRIERLYPAAVETYLARVARIAGEARAARAARMGAPRLAPPARVPAFQG
ncbi:MAG: DUF3332 family protein [Deltaproteobacteria bacterium]|nr:DUF3332 family protein [Deltaproteobacteria bacterium]